jgi:hypothetical protein
MKCQWLMEAISFDDKPPVEKIYTVGTRQLGSKMFCRTLVPVEGICVKKFYVGNVIFDSKT